MLKRVLNVLVIALALCVAAAFGGEVWRASHAPVPPNQSTPAQKSYQSNHNAREERPDEANSPLQPVAYDFPSYPLSRTTRARARGGAELWAAPPPILFLGEFFLI